jgi:hypothetical protein
MYRSNEPARAGGTSFVRESGAEIAGHLWTKRRSGLDDRSSVEAALAWSRARHETQNAGERSGLRNPAALVASLSCEAGSQNPIGGMLERASRDLRFARFMLEPSTNLLGNAAPRPEDALDTLVELERTLEVVTKLVYLEQDAVVLALHAAAHGAVPEALEQPGGWAEGSRKAAISLERAAEAIGADRLDVDAASAALRSLGCDLDEAPADSVAELLVTLMRLRGRLDGAASSSEASRERAIRTDEGDDDGHGNGGTGGAAPPSSSPPMAPPAPPVAPVTMVPSTLGSAPWRGAPPPARAPRRRIGLRALPFREHVSEVTVAPASSLRRKGAA